MWACAVLGFPTDEARNWTRYAFASRWGGEGRSPDEGRACQSPPSLSTWLLPTLRPTNEPQIVHREALFASRHLDPGRRRAPLAASSSGSLKNRSWLCR